MNHSLGLWPLLGAGFRFVAIRKMRDGLLAVPQGDLQTILLGLLGQPQAWGCIEASHPGT